MSLNHILSTGRSSLLAHQAAIQVASNNTANADVEGFSKRDVNFESLAGRSGVEVSSVRRRADAWMSERLMLERSRLGTQSSQSQGLAAVELELGNIETGLGPALDQFFRSVRNLQPDPTSGQGRADLIAQAQTLVETFNVAADRLDRERNQADDMLAAEATSTNGLLTDIAELNERIMRAVADGNEPSHDLDRRDMLLGELGEALDVTTIDGGDGSITVLLAGGVTLVQGGQTAQLQTTVDPALGGLRRVELVTAEGLATDVTADIRSGRVGGLLDLRDGFLADVESRIDQLAFDLATSVNNVHRAGFGADGVSGRNFFAPPAQPGGAAVNLSLATGLTNDTIAASTTAAAAVGGNDNLLELANLADQNLADGGRLRFGEEYAAIVATVGTRVSQQREAELQAQIKVDQLSALKDSQTGVSIDEEMIDITRFERAFQAASRIIQTVDEMFDAVLQL